MKKLIVLFLGGALLLSSCGKDKKNDSDVPDEEVVAKDNFSIVLNAIYEKDDELSFVYKKNGYWDYDHPTKYAVKGQPNSQMLNVPFPLGEKCDNIQVDVSTNKEQKVLKLTDISILNNGKEIVNGRNMAFIKYFNFGTAFTWDEKNLRYNLLFDQEYPPRIVGSDALEAILAK